MPCSETAIQEFLERLSEARSITHRKMFGGVGVYSGGVFFAVIDDDRLYFKVDETNKPDFERRKSQQWMPDPRTGALMPYFELPRAILRDTESLGEWIDRSVQVALKKKSPSKSSKKSK